MHHPDPPTACIVIPVYKTELSETERVSLDQCVSVFHSRPITLVVPESLNVHPLLERYPNTRWLIERFADEFFKGVRGYNRLMLSEEFYARFSRFDFMLIYQLDAYVFEDQLDYWCRKPFDYIGAPWLPSNRIPSRLRLLKRQISGAWLRLIDRRNPDGTDDFRQQHFIAGNGGFCLRRIAAMRRVLIKLDSRAEPFRNGTRGTWAEDIFFSIEANRYRRYLRIPDFRIAAQFAWEGHPEVAKHFSSVSRPFGIHAWNLLPSTQWRRIMNHAVCTTKQLTESEMTSQV